MGFSMRAQRGTVAIENFQGMLRLRWSYSGKRYCLSLGFPDSRVNQTRARGLASQIEGDLATGNFDSTLAKYRTERQRANDLTVLELLEKFRQYKARSLTNLSKCDALINQARQFFGSKTVASVNELAADDFRLWLAKKLAPSTQRERIITIRAAWRWGVDRKLVQSDPWGEVLARVPAGQRQKPSPFTDDEVFRILATMRQHRHYRHYADFAEFLLCTGCRPGEAIALQWQHLAADCSIVWIGEAMTRDGVRKSTKNERARRFGLSQRLQDMLLARRPVGFGGDDLVFPAPRGGRIVDNRFCKRPWRKALEAAGVPYRYPYACRHTFISHALRQRHDPGDVAAIAGHDKAVLFAHYAAEIGTLSVPDLYRGIDPANFLENPKTPVWQGF
ncbi:MAG: hypothetical protein OHK0037_27630 [Elainellaceae cyanobacterium]